MIQARRPRVESIDLLRGLVMVIMALDHARVFFYHGSFFGHPTDLATTTPILVFTRWITHFCAPVFVFLAGTGAYLYGTRRETTGQLAWFLLSRGLWLVILELTVINFAWTFDVALSARILQVIWAIGVSMMLLAGLVFLPRPLLLATGVVLAAGHNLLDGIRLADAGASGMLWYLLHKREFVPTSASSAILVVYPLIPWIGTMVLGFGLGEIYQHGYDAPRRRRWLLRLGVGAAAAFIVLRFWNLYGDPGHWRPHSTGVLSLLSFLNTTKYPPSLLFLLMTLGPSLLFLRATEGVDNRLTRPLVVLGRVPLFFYVAHLYLLHALAMLGLVLLGGSWREMVLTAQTFFTQSLADYGYGLPVVYAVWAVALLALLPICRLFDGYKARNRHRRWLSYL